MLYMRVTVEVQIDCNPELSSFGWNVLLVTALYYKASDLPSSDPSKLKQRVSIICTNNLNEFCLGLVAVPRIVLPFASKRL